MPILGYGVYQVTKEDCERCVLDALKVGYRHIDAAGEENALLPTLFIYVYEKKSGPVPRKMISTSSSL